MIRTYIGLPPPLTPSSPAPISTDASGMHRQSFADVHQCIAEVSPKLRRCITDHLSKQSAIVTECSANIRLCRRCFGEHSPNHRKSIFFIGTAGILCSKSQGIGKHRVYNYTFHHRRCKNPQWDRRIS